MDNYENNIRKINITDHPAATIVLAILGIAIGIFFIFSQSVNKPIARADAVAYVGYFDEYDTSKNYCGISCKDGSVYEVYPYTETNAFREKMNALAKGTKLYILVNPNNQYAIEIKTETEELLNFEISQQEIDAYDNGYVAIGIAACACGVFLIIGTIISLHHKRKETARYIQRKSAGNDTATLRYADTDVKSRTLLETTVGTYHICYRRVKFVNELVVNGWVYDESKGVIEFEHRLFAFVDGHEIEAGYDNESYSYILFDGERIKQKKRLI